MPQALSPRRYTPVRPAVCGCVGLLDRPPTSSTHSLTLWCSLSRLTTTIAGMRQLAQRAGRARWLGRGGVRDSMGRVAVTLTRAGALCRPRRLLLWPVLYRA